MRGYFERLAAQVVSARTGHAGRVTPLEQNVEVGALTGGEPPLALGEPTQVPLVHGKPHGAHGLAVTETVERELPGPSPLPATSLERDVSIERPHAEAPGSLASALEARSIDRRDSTPTSPFESGLERLEMAPAGEARSIERSVRTPTLPFKTVLERPEAPAGRVVEPAAPSPAARFPREREVAVRPAGAVAPPRAAPIPTGDAVPVGETSVPGVEIHIGSISLEVHAPAAVPQSPLDVSPAPIPKRLHDTAPMLPRERFSPHRYYLGRG